MYLNSHIVVLLSCRSARKYKSVERLEIFQFLITTRIQSSVKIEMKVVIVAVAVLSAALLVEGQLSMNNPNYCYSSDPVRPQNGMHSTQASYEAIRRPSVNPSVSCEWIYFAL